MGAAAHDTAHLRPRKSIGELPAVTAITEPLKVGYTPLTMQWWLQMQTNIARQHIKRVKG